MARPRTGTRERLLSDAMGYVAEHGINDLNLRDLATALGTSARMLIFHFGSKDEILVEIVRNVEQRQREFLRRVGAEAGQPPTAALRALWQHLLDPSLIPYERLFFELYGQALQGRAHAASLLDGIVEDWLGPVGEIFARMGLPPDRARQDARLAVAVTRGLLMDMLATGDQEAATEGFERFLSAHEALRAPGLVGAEPAER
jgi:AcrR family transcriptional regulator